MDFEKGKSESDAEGPNTHDTKGTYGKGLMIVPPGLIGKFVLFVHHCKVAEKRPILIVGDTGVGKSLFINMFKIIFNKGKQKTIKDNVLRKANCAQFSRELASSELFGHEKGAFTGAIKRKEGLIKTADNGYLILEEIGTLPKSVQSKLLTVIEDGEYNRVGGTKRETVSDLQLVGATNNTDSLRNDFKARFFSFYVPPVYMRRLDVLYYLTKLNIDLVRKLLPWETLSLLCYNWPENVREIQILAMFIERRKSFIKEFIKENIAISIQDGSIFVGIEGKDDMLGIENAKELYLDLSEKGVDVDSLENILAEYGLGINPNNIHETRNQNMQYFFGNISERDLSRRDFPSFYLDYAKKYKQPLRDGATLFDKAYEGFLLFCSLFFQNPKANQNIIKVKEGTSIEFYFNIDKITKKHQQIIIKLAKQIFEYLTNIKLPKNQVFPIEYHERLGFLTEMASSNPSNAFLCSLVEKRLIEANMVTGGTPDIYSMSYDEAMRHYHAEVLKRCSNNKRAAAKQLKVNPQTLYSRLNRLGI